MIELHINNLYTHVNKKKVTKEENEAISDLLSVKVPGYYFSPMYKRGLWDGKVKFYHRGTGAFYTGLIGYIKTNLSQYQFTEIDERKLILHKNNPIDLHGIELRDYQKQAILQAVQKGRGIIASPTNSGKTEISCGIIKVLGLPANFITHRRKLLWQTKKRFETRLGREVGVIGDQVQDIKDINILSIQTIAKRLKDEDPVITELLKNTQVVISDECFTANTRVLVDTNLTVTIKEIYDSPLTYVLSYNHDLNVLERKKIIRKIKKQVNSDYMLHLTVDFGNYKKIVRCTPNHKIFSGENYKQADQFKIGDNVKILTSNFLNGKYCTKCNKVVRLGNIMPGLPYHRHYIKPMKPCKLPIQIKCHKCNHIFKTRSDFSSHHMNDHYKNTDGKIINIKKHPVRKRDYVYNLEIEDNHNYFVEGVLVSNCHRVTAATWEKCLKACSNAYYRYGLCVSSGTKVLLSSGKERKIGTLWSEGLKEFNVLSFNHLTNKMEPKKAIISRIPWVEDILIVKIRSENGEIAAFGCSPQHKVYSNERYVEAQNLKIGDKVLMASIQKNYCKVCRKEIPTYRRLCGKECTIRNWSLEGAKGQSKRLQKMTKEERRIAINWKVGLEKLLEWATSENGKKYNSEYMKNRFKNDPEFVKAVSNGGKKVCELINKKGLGLKGCRNRWIKYPTKKDRLNHLQEIGCFEGFKKTQFKKGHTLSSHPPLVDGKYYNNKVCFGKDGHKLVSGVEKKVDDWLFDHNLEHKIHPRIEGTGKYADFLVNDWYIEADGLSRGFDYFRKKYENNTNWVLIDDFSYSSINEKLSFLLVTDPIGEVLSIRSVKFNGKFLYDLSVEDNNNFFANGILVHNSATPLLRGDHNNLKVLGLTGDEIITVTDQQLTDWGYSAYPSVFLKQIDKPSFPKNYPYDKIYEEGVMFNPYRNNFIVETAKHWNSIGKTVFIIVFRIPHGEEIKRVLNEAGIKAEFISGKSKSNDEVLERFEKRELVCLISSTISDEGLDIPAIDVLVIAVEDEAALKVVQRVGRGRRKKVEGENVIIIVDFVHTNKNGAALKKHSVSRLEQYNKMGIQLYEVRGDWGNVVKL